MPSSFGTGRVQLAWARCAKGNLLDVENAKGLGTADRALLTCPETACAGRVVPRKGEIRVPHFAHFEEAPDCPASGGEGALHLNAKVQLFKLLQRERTRIGPFTLRLSAVCSRPVCSKVFHFDWVDGISLVEMEGSLQGARPDVLVTGLEGAQRGLEVVVSHRVSDEKARHLKELQVPWIEIRPEQIPGLESGWTSESPLKPERLSHPRICQHCARERAQDRREGNTAPIQTRPDPPPAPKISRPRLPRPQRPSGPSEYRFQALAIYQPSGERELRTIVWHQLGDPESPYYINVHLDGFGIFKWDPHWVAARRGEDRIETARTELADFIQGLRDGGLPVQVLSEFEEGDKTALLERVKDIAADHRWDPERRCWLPV